MTKSNNSQLVKSITKIAASLILIALLSMNILVLGTSKNLTNEAMALDHLPNPVPPGGGGGWPKTCYATIYHSYWTCFIVIQCPGPWFDLVCYC